MPGPFPLSDWNLYRLILINCKCLFSQLAKGAAIYTFLKDSATIQLSPNEFYWNLLVNFNFPLFLLGHGVMD